MVYGYLDGPKIGRPRVVIQTENRRGGAGRKEKQRGGTGREKNRQLEQEFLWGLETKKAKQTPKGHGASFYVPLYLLTEIQKRKEKVGENKKKQQRER